MYRSDFRTVITPSATWVQALAPASTRVAILFSAPARASDGSIRQYMVVPSSGQAGTPSGNQLGIFVESGAPLLITREHFGDAITVAWYAQVPGSTGPDSIAILQSFDDSPAARTGG